VLVFFLFYFKEICRNAICLKQPITETTFDETNIAQMALAKKIYPICRKNTLPVPYLPKSLCRNENQSP
jgi:hypothetical protein